MGIDAQMYAATTSPLTPLEVRKLAGSLIEAFSIESPFWIDRDSDRHCLRIIDQYDQDGPTIFPNPVLNEQFIEVNFMCRYYGDSYERGPLPTIITVASWLEQRIPNSRIYYGGDSSGVEATLFDAPARQALLDHFIKVGHRPYSMSFSPPYQKDYPHCEFCGNIPMERFGSGPGYNLYRCGCDYEIKIDNITKEITVLVDKKRY